MRATTGRTIKEFAVTYLLVIAIAVPLLTLITLSVLWIETGSPWAGPVVLGALALVLAAGLWATRPWRR